jgi:hypothetical protein
MEIQSTRAERSANTPEERRIEFRIGINAGDIIIDDGDIYGDGVNIAARVETMAGPGAICLSENAYQQIKGKTPNFHQALRMAAAGHALAGRLDIARKAMGRLRQIDPDLRVSNLFELTPLRRAQDMARYQEGLRKAGLPE